MVYFGEPRSVMCSMSPMRLPPRPKDRWLTGCDLPPMEEVSRGRVDNTRYLPTRGDGKNWDIVDVK